MTTRTRRTASNDEDHGPQHGPFERFLLSIMGPAEIGDPQAPVTYEADESASLCAKCDQPYDQHERVHSSVTYLKCPSER